MDLIYSSLVVKSADPRSLRVLDDSYLPFQVPSPSLYAYLASIVDFHDNMVIASIGSLLHFLLAKERDGESEGSLVTTIVVREVVTLMEESLMRVDRDTMAALNVFSRELHPNVIQGKGRAKDGLGLFTLLDRTMSDVGKERLKEWLYRPFAEVEAILLRQDAVEVMTKLVYLDFQIAVAQNLQHVQGILNTLQR